MRHYSSYRNARSKRIENFRRLLKPRVLATLSLWILLVVALPFALSSLARVTGPWNLNGILGQDAHSVADVIEQVKPAVVNIAIIGKDDKAAGSNPYDLPKHPQFRDFFRQPDGNDESPEAAAPDFSAFGSGFIVSSDGYVVTNSHVVGEAEQITVTLDDTRRYLAVVQGIDATTDIALLKIQDNGPFPHVSFGESDSARTGDQIVAIGNPFGLGNTATTGIISARGRDIQSGPFDDFIQIDAPINQGNSGGPLFDMRGRVIGINTAIFSPNGGNVGIGFAIPSTLAQNIVEQLHGQGFVERSWLGIQIQPISDELVRLSSLDQSAGGVVAGVSPNSPAERAGLEVGDIITSFNDRELGSPKDLARVVASAKPNREYSLGIWRNGESIYLSVVTTMTPETSNLQAALNPPHDIGSDGAQLGLALAPLNESRRRKFDVDEEITQGAVIVKVKRGSPAAKIGLKTGDVITRVGGREVSDPIETAREIHKSELSQESILLQINRQDRSKFLSVLAPPKTPPEPRMDTDESEEGAVFRLM